MRVRILENEIANKIAAGEVVESPASVIKELIENSLDANSSTIKVHLKDAGFEKIRVIDDGSGIHPDDIELAFHRHATNKIGSEYDLNKISTLGFRGEALSSIASVSKVQIKTRQEEMEEGIKAIFEAGKLSDKESCGTPVGTDIEVMNLFYNTPARYKFLRKKQNEIGHITDIINKLSLGNPGVSFTLVNDDKRIMKTNGKGDLLEVIASIYGFQTVKKMMEVNYSESLQDKDDRIRVYGYVSKPELTRATKNYQVFFVNGRYIRSKLLTDALEDAYKRLLPKGRYPIAVIKLELPYEEVDVNVHPAKMQLRFDKRQPVMDILKKGVNNAMKRHELIPEISPGKKSQEKERLNESPEAKSQGTIQSSIHTAPNRESLGDEQATEKDLFKTNQNESLKDFMEEAEKVDEAKVDGVKENALEYIPQDKDKEQDHPPSFFELFDLQMKDYKILGQVFQTYWLLEKDETLYFIDQHAAHERVNYHKYLKQHRENPVISQSIIPFTLELDSSELLLVEQNIDDLKELGLELEFFGHNTLLVRAVPFVVKDICDGNFIKDFISSLASAMRKDSRETNFDKSSLEDLLISIACKKSIKANQKISEKEFEELMLELESLSNPYTCPHGRPTIIRFSRKDIEKYFKRIM